MFGIRGDVTQTGKVNQHVSPCKFRGHLEMRVSFGSPIRFVPFTPECVYIFSRDRAGSVNVQHVRATTFAPRAAAKVTTDNCASECAPRRVACMLMVASVSCACDVELNFWPQRVALTEGGKEFTRHSRNVLCDPGPVSVRSDIINVTL